MVSRCEAGFALGYTYQDYMRYMSAWEITRNELIQILIHLVWDASHVDISRYILYMLTLQKLRTSLDSLHISCRRVMISWMCTISMYYLYPLHDRFIYAFIMQSVLWQVHSRSHSEFSTECNLVLLFCNSSIFCFPSGHQVAVYIFFLALPSLPPFLK